MPPGDRGAVVGVVVGLVHEREHLARLRVEDHERTCSCVLRLHRRPELAVREELQALVDRERHLVAVARRPHGLDVLDDAALAVANHLAAAGNAGKAIVGGELHALLAVVLDAGESDDVRHHFARGVVAAEFALLEDAGNPQSHDFGRLLGRNLALEIDELAIFPGNFLAQLLRVERERRGERSQLAFVELEILGARPDGFHRRGNRERLAVAVLHRAARSRHVEDAAVTRLALRLEEIGVHRLQVERAPRKDGEARAHEPEHEARAPSLELQAQLRRSLLEVHGDLILSPERAPPGASSVTTTVVVGSGSRMPRWREATASMRLFVAHVPCSSCSCVNSSSRRLAAACSASRSMKSLRAWCCDVTTASAQATRRTRKSAFKRVTPSSPRRAAPRFARADCAAPRPAMA